MKASTRSPRPSREESPTPGEYRGRWQWERTAWGTHCVDCYPGNCAFRVYVKDGRILREEQSGTYRTVEEGVPDMNPMGCQKGAAWATRSQAKDRLLYPMQRRGERGSGRWRRITWDRALTLVADAVLDAIEEAGPASIIHETAPAQGGLMAVVAPARFNQLIGGTTLDLEGMINDFNVGQYVTFGKWAVSSADDWFHSDTLFIWHMNPAFTRIPFCHFIAEARYRGAEVITVAPDFNASAVHADRYVGVRPGSDAALALAMCKVIIDEGLVDEEFAREQTDLPLLVRTDTLQFLRGSEMEEGGREDQFYVFDKSSGAAVGAPRETLDYGDTRPALQGRHMVKMAGSETVETTPVFELVRELLHGYTPEKASQMCGVAPDVIRHLARRAAGGRTNFLTGFNVCKYYHGDLMERAMCLVLALTGNWGKKGTGIRSWSPGPLDGVLLFGAARQMGIPGGTGEVLAAVRGAIETIKRDYDAPTDEMAVIKLGTDWLPRVNNVPSSFFLYYHAGFRERWNRAEWHDATMAEGFDAALAEAVRLWWEPNVERVRDTPPRVLIEVGGNILRRTRGGQEMLLQHLWPKFRMVATVDTRMTSTAMYSDILLPAADHHEKVNLTYTTPHVLQLHMADQAVEPPGQAKPEWEIFRLLCRKVAERAARREMTEYPGTDGKPQRFADLYDSFTAGVEEPEELLRKWIDDSTTAGNVAPGTTLESLRKDGHVRLTNWGLSVLGLAQSSDLAPDETHSPYRWHVEKKLVYPTLTRRAQFYIDHPWFIRMGEALPAHKENPKMGGDYALELTSGHNRWSIHSQQVTDRLLTQTHRSSPCVWLNPGDAAERGIEDGDEVRAYNDAGAFVAPAKLAPSVRPGQVVMYNGWEPYQFPGWRDPSNLEPGMVKPLHLAAGYGHLAYHVGAWQIVTVDRGTRIEVERVAGERAKQKA